MLRKTSSATAGRIGVVIAIAYSSIVFLLWVLQWPLSEAVPGIGLVKSLLHLLLLPCLALLILFLLTRRWKIALGVTPAVVAFLFSYGPLLAPRAHAVPSSAPTVQVMSFNLQAPDEQEAAALAAIIARAGADVIVLQELSPQAAAHFETALQATYPHQALHPRQDDHAGQGVLSRYLITSDEYWRYEELPGALGHQRVELEIDGVRVVLYNSHIVPPLTLTSFRPAAHRQALQYLMQQVRAEAGPLLWAGDFNMTDQFHGYRELTAEYKDAYREAGEIGFGFTYPDKGIPLLPVLLRLDYVFYDEAFTGVFAEVWADSGPSDHRPVVARLLLPGRQAN